MYHTIVTLGNSKFLKWIQDTTRFLMTQTSCDKPVSRSAQEKCVRVIVMKECVVKQDGTSI